MTCKGVHAFVSDWVEGDLPRETLEMFLRHLDSCASCRAYVDSYEEAIALAKRAGRESEGPVPEALVRAILVSAGRATPD